MIRKCQNINVFYLKLRRRNCQKGKKMETIISACISAAVTLVVCVICDFFEKVVDDLILMC